MRILSSILAACMCLSILVFGGRVSAQSELNSLTLHYYAVNEALPLANAEFFLYCIAEPDGLGGYELTAAFDEYQVDIDNLDWNEAGRLTELAVTLSAYVARDDIVPQKIGNTDSHGDLTFHDLTDGLYLVWGEPLAVDVDDTQWKFTPQPLILPLPYPDSNGDIREMEVDVKYDRFPPPTMDDLVDLTVMKVWDGGDEHPDSVTAELMRNGIVTDSAVLDASNNWQYTWKSLNTGFIWQISEKDVPAGYTVSVHQDGYVFTITNKKSDTEDETNIPTESTAETPSDVETTATSFEDFPPSSDDPTEPVTNDPPDTDTSSTNSTGTVTTTVTPANPNSPGTPTKLPQTGQLWWPVPVLAGMGFLMIGTGILLRRDEDEDEA